MDKKILGDFKDESTRILKELGSLVETMEEGQTSQASLKALSEFSQRVDRIMGAAKMLSVGDPSHLGLKRIGQISELCKTLGYQAAGTGATPLLPIFAAFWADAVDVLKDFVDALEDDAKTQEVSKDVMQMIERRMEWLATRLNSGTTKGAHAFDVKTMLKNLGIGG